MPSPSPEAFALAERYRLGLAETPHRGPAGDRLGKGTGASLEFQDRRVYVPGDDVRHLDWAAYGRTDQLMVRLYREEILPRVDLVVDGSKSMGVDAEKAQLTVDLAALLYSCARAGGFAARLLLASDRPERIGLEQLQSEGLAFTGVRPLQESVQGALSELRQGSIRILVSDFLSPHEASGLVRPLAARAGGIALLQVLGRADATPEEGSALRLTDVETGGTLDLVLDRRTIELYETRLGRLADGLARECRRAGGRFVSVTVGRPLDALCRTILARDGLLTPV